MWGWVCVRFPVCLLKYRLRVDLILVSPLASQSTQGRNAYKDKLREIEMSEHDAGLYTSIKQVREASVLAIRSLPLTRGGHRRWTRKSRS